MDSNSDQSAEITKLLHRWRGGNPEAESQLFEIVMPNLKKLAHFFMKGERKDHPLQATELVSEAYLQLIAIKDRDWQSRQHFFALTARIMRRYLIGVANQNKVKFIPIDPDRDLNPVFTNMDAIILGEVLDQLALVKPEWCTVVELKYFLAFTDEEVADAMAASVRTVQRMWRDARKWLYRRLKEREDPK